MILTLDFRESAFLVNLYETTGAFLYWVSVHRNASHHRIVKNLGET